MIVSWNGKSNPPNGKNLKGELLNKMLPAACDGATPHRTLMVLW